MSDQVQPVTQEVTEAAPAKKPRKQRADKGKLRGPRKPKAATTEG